MISTDRGSTPGEQMALLVYRTDAEARKQNQMKPLDTLQKHVVEYLIEAWGLGTLLFCAGIYATLLFYPASPIHQLIPDPFIRRVTMGIAMGATIYSIIASPWSRRSGAHLNPAVTFTFYRLGRVKLWDALFYMLFQFLGGLLGILLAQLILKEAFTAKPVQYIVTVPGRAGVTAAFTAEFLVSTLTMFVVQSLSNHPRLSPITPKVVGLLVVCYFIFASPYSGFSMNPARTIASALPSGIWTATWLYLVAPISGMVLGVELYLRLHPRPRVRCGKLWYDHTTPCGRADRRGTTPCIFCENRSPASQLFN